MIPSDTEITRQAVISWLDNCHTALPGRVESYDAGKQSASVLPAVKRSLKRAEDAGGGWAHRSYPVIPNVKVAWLAAGGCSLQMPLAKGDSVWLCFSESCWASYRLTGEVTAPGDERRFDLSYPIAIPVQLVTALRQVTGPHFEVPGGQALTVGGAPAALVPVALAPSVEQDIAQLKTLITGWIPVANDGGADLKTALTDWAAGATNYAATKLRTE